MDKASSTIDRHTPIIPESLWFELSPELERIYTKTKNRLILPKSKSVVNRHQEKRIITDEMLEKADRAVIASENILSDPIRDYLTSRGITDAEIKLWRICETSRLVELLDNNAIDNLTLRIPNKFKNVVKSTTIYGVTIPYYRDKKLCGFVTRVLNEELLKYCVTVPNRLCFGTDFDAKEVYVVEGVFDSIALRSIGINPLGMADSQPNFYKMLVANRFETINLMFDTDYAGWLGAIKAYTILTQMLNRDKSTINILKLNSKDPELAVRNSALVFGKTTFEEIVDLAKRGYHGFQITS